MKTLVKNLFLSSLPCFALTILFSQVELAVLKNIDNHKYIETLNLSFLYIYFLFWPLIQAILLNIIYGFKSLLIKILSFVLLYISIPLGWCVFFLVLHGSNKVTLLSQSGMYLTILMVQIFLFFIFIKRSRE